MEQILCGVHRIVSNVTVYVDKALWVTYETSEFSVEKKNKH